MPLNKDSESKLLRVCLRINRSDYEFLRSLANTGPVPVSLNRVIREAIATIVRQMRDRERQKIDQLPAPTFVLELEDLEA